MNLLATKAFIVLVVLTLGGYAAANADPLSSWNDGTSRRAVVDFVDDVTKLGGPDFVPPSERIAVFDNDGTLWTEQPAYFQLMFALDRVKALAPAHPEWRHNQPFKGVLENDLEAALAEGERALVEIVMATHAGMTTKEFSALASEWISTAIHPTSGRRYTEMVFQPMLELLDYLRANQFRIFIVSGGGIEFLRVFAEEVYDVPPEQVVGSIPETEFEMRDGKPVITRLPGIHFINDKAGKPIAINQHIGRRPIAAFGNSDGDLQMLQWTTAGEGARLGVIIHHTDANREWAYDRDSHIGRLDKALDESKQRGWLVVDMEKDWNRIYP
jgi:phosphoserine phosphatase